MRYSRHLAITKLRVLGAVALCATATPVRADDHGRENVIIADGIADAVILSATIPHMPHKLLPVLFWGGLLGQGLTAPILHAVDGDWGRAGIDLGVRAATPVLGALVGGALCEKLTTKGKGEFLHCLGGALLGGIAGVIAAQMVDWLVLSRPTDDGLATPRILRINARF